MKKIESVSKIKEWLELLPKVPSHYCRKSTSKIYVESTFFSLSDMFRVYSVWIIEQGFLSASKTLFLNTLKSEKISIHKPRKDQCDVCCGHKNGTIEESEYNANLERKTLAREEKNCEKVWPVTPKLLLQWTWKVYFYAHLLMHQQCTINKNYKYTISLFIDYMIMMLLFMYGMKEMDM